MNFTCWSDHLHCCHFDFVTKTQIAEQCSIFHHTFTNALSLSHQLANNQKHLLSSYYQQRGFVACKSTNIAYKTNQYRKGSYMGLSEI